MTQKKTRSRRQPVKAGLKGFATAKKTSSNELMREINQFVVAEGDRNAGVGRESHKIHVSEVIKDVACPRQMFYKVTGVEPTDPPAPAFHRLEIIWASGHDAHHKWQKWMWGMGELWGTFACRLCEHRWVALSPVRCENCGEDKEFLTYEEVEFEDAAYHLVGHADGAVPSKRTLVEIKSFSIGTVRIENPGLVKEHTHKVDGKTIVDTEGVWNAIKRPLRGHLHQGMFYLWFCKRMGLPFDTITYIYENKTTQATKTFTVGLTERFIAQFLDTLEGVAQAIETKTVPDRPELYSPEGKPCNHCVFRTECWGDDESTANEPTSPEVPTGGSGPGGDASGRGTALRRTRPARSSASGDSGRPHGDRRPSPDRADDADDQVGRASRRASRAGRGRRAVVRGGDGSSAGTRVTRNRQGRD